MFHESSFFSHALARFSFSKLLLLVQVLVVASVGRAAPIVVYEQTPESPFIAGTSQFFPSVGSFGFHYWDNFTLTNTESISTVAWLGSYFDLLDSTNNPASPNASGFGVEFFSDSSNAPGSLLGGATFALLD